MDRNVDDVHEETRRQREVAEAQREHVRKDRGQAGRSDEAMREAWKRISDGDPQEGENDSG
jgi:hypothetical protein